MSSKRDDKGKFTSPSDKTINRDMQHLLALYLKSMQQQKGNKTSSVDTRQREVRYWLAFCEANDIEPLAATTDDVRAYIQTNKGKADPTIDSYYRSVQSFYSIIDNDQLHDVLELEHGHPCRDKNTIDLREDYNVYANTSDYQRANKLTGREIDIARDKSHKSNVIAIKPEAIEKLFRDVPGEKEGTRLRNEVLARLSWYTGCRSDELSRMRVEKINWDNCTINIRSAKLNAKDHPDLIRRDVCFPQKFKYQLKRWVYRVRESFSSEVPERDDSDEPRGYILVSEQGESMEPASINDVIKESARNAGIQRPLMPADLPPDYDDDDVDEWLVTSHRIRRSAISHWVNDCEHIDTHQAQRLAGHAKIQQTMDYVEPDDDQMVEDYHKSMG